MARKEKLGPGLQVQMVTTTLSSVHARHSHAETDRLKLRRSSDILEEYAWCLNT